MYGELLPLGGGDPIPLQKKDLLIGRREACDIVLRFANVSAHHCRINVNDGYWYVRDLDSRNGVKVNGARISQRRLDPGDVLSVAKHDYEVKYSPADIGAVGPPPADLPEEAIFGKSLLERAGLERYGVAQSGDSADSRQRQRYEIARDEPGLRRPRCENSPSGRGI